MTPTNQKQHDRIVQQRINVILDDPFFGVLLMRMPLIEDTAIPTFCTNGVHIRYNPAFCAKLSGEEVRGVLVHEVMHVALAHHLRRGHRDPRQWNHAADHAINNHMEEYAADMRRSSHNWSGYKLPEGGLVNPAFKNMSAEEIYAKLPPPPPQGGGGPGKGQGQPDPAGEVEDFPGDASQQAAAEAELKITLTQAAQAAKRQGRVPSSISRLVEEILKPRIPWAETLRRFVTERRKDDYTWSKPNPRHLGRGFILPSLDGEGMGTIAVCVDTSGSIGSEDLAEFIAEINGIMTDCQPSKLIVVYADAAVNHVDEFSPGDFIEPRAVGGGGTDFRPFFDHLATLDEPPECAIYLTDMMGEFPKSEPHYPVLWVSTHGDRAPFGEVVPMK